MRYKQDESTVACVPCHRIQRGVYVKKNLTANKVYKRGAYDSQTKRYELEDCGDISRTIWVKRTAELWVGFTY